MAEDSDVVLLAENHLTPNHADLETDIISSLDSEYVVLEDSRPEFNVQKLIQNFNQYKILYDTAKEFNEKYGERILFEDPETIYNESIEALKDKKSIEGIVPNDVEEFVSLPLYEMDPEFIDRVSESVKERVEEISSENSFKESLKELHRTYSVMHKATDKRSACIPRQFDYLNPMVIEDEINIVSETFDAEETGYSHHPYPFLESLTRIVRPKS